MKINCSLTPFSIKVNISRNEKKTIIIIKIYIKRNF